MMTQGNSSVRIQRPAGRPLSRELLMTWRSILLSAALAFALARPASAGIFSFFRHAKPAPNQHVAELVQTLRSDANDGKRAAAAEELRQYDPTAYPEIVPALVEALQHDAKPEVRGEAAQSLGKLRPAAPEVKAALEQASANDSAPRVRSLAAAALAQQTPKKGWFSRTPKNDGPALTPPPGTATTTEPPLANSEPPAPKPAPAPAPTIVAPPPAPAVARPMPSARPPLVPTEAPHLQTPPPAPEQGPALSPP
jgi:hypothetical protein